MSSGYPSLINPGPVAHPAKNTHRVGASNHHQTGSGENPMVGGNSSADLIDAVYARLDSERARFLRFWSAPGGPFYDRRGLAELVAEIVTEHTNDLRAERDAADDAVLDLLHDLESGGGQ